MHALSPLRILEIGDKPYVKGAFPRETTYFSTAFTKSADDPAAGLHSVTLRGLPGLIRLARDPGLSLIVCHPTYYSPWHWRALSRALFDRRALRGHIPLLRMFGPQLLRRAVPTPIAVIDHEDLPLINRSHFFLLARCRAYFKRELPPDRWRLLMKTAHANLPTPRFRLRSRFASHLDKVRPISLGIPTGRDALLFGTPADKSADVFFAGRVEGSSTVRAAGFAELLALRERGLVVDIPEAPLPPAEFYARCARARLTWSPEGLGWDCFRHYEAPACGSVPVINQPAIERHAPLRDGEHAVYYDPEPGGLTRAVTAALSDKPRLVAMARAGQAHVRAHHTTAALVRYIVGTTLGLPADALGRDGGP